MLLNKRRVLNLNNHPRFLCLSWEVISLGFYCTCGGGGGGCRRMGLNIKTHQQEGVPLCFGELSQLCCVSPLSLIEGCPWSQDLEGWGKAGWGWGGHRADICWELSSDSTGVRTHISSWLCVQDIISRSAHRNMKAPELKPRAQGHTANKTPWGVRSDTWEQNPDFTCMVIVESLNILRCLFSYLLNGYNSEPQLPVESQWDLLHKVLAYAVLNTQYLSAAAIIIIMLYFVYLSLRPGRVSPDFYQAWHTTEPVQWSLQASCLAFLLIVAGRSKKRCIMLKYQHHHPLAHQWLKPQGKCKVDLFQGCFSVKWYFKQTWHLNIHIDRHSILGRSNLPLQKNIVRRTLVGMLAATKLDSLYKTEVRCSWCVWSHPAPLLHLSFSVPVTCRLCRSDLKLPPSHLRRLIRGERLIGEKASSNLLGSSCMSCQSSL